MKKCTRSIAALLCIGVLSITGKVFSDDISQGIPEFEVPQATAAEGFKKVENVAQYQFADWSCAVGICRGITLDQACEIAKSHPEVTYFFYTKGGCMVLKNQDGEGNRIFRHGDTVFFTGTPWWGSAPGLADGYIKQ